MADPEIGSDGFPLCKVCRGEKKDHGEGKSVHAYTTMEGQLETSDQQARRLSQGRSGPTPTTVLPMRSAAIDGPLAFSRLIEVLLQKEMIDSTEALYIAGFGPPKGVKSDGAAPGTDDGN